MNIKVGVLVALAFVAALGLVVSIASQRPLISKNDYEKVQTGMTLEATTSQLHGPPRNELDRRAIIWVPQRNGQKISAFVDVGPFSQDFFPGSTLRGQRQVWITRSALVAAEFGPDGRLRKKYFSEVEVIPGPTVWGWIASRPEQFRKSLGF